MVVNTTGLVVRDVVVVVVVVVVVAAAAAVVAVAVAVEAVQGAALKI